MSLGLALALVPLLILMNAFFVAAEYALVAIRSTQIEALRIKKPGGATSALAYLKDNLADTVAAVQVGITMINLLLGYIGEPAMGRVLDFLFAPLLRLLPDALVHGISFVLSLIIVTLLTVVLSELVPKAVTLRYVETVGLMVARPILLFQKLAWPLVWLMNKLANGVTVPMGLGRIEEIDKQSHTTEELMLITTEAAADGVLSPRERSLILNTLSLGKRTARQIMISRVHVDYLDLRRTMDENMAVLESRLHSRLPLCDGGMDHVFGVVTTKEFLSAYQAGADPSVMQLIARPAVFVPETLTVDKLLPLFSEHQTQMLFLVSEYGGVEGLVTLKDVVDELLREQPMPEKPDNSLAETEHVNQEHIAAGR
jgi:CBS domain containing-hemolysin-like protein